MAIRSYAPPEGRLCRLGVDGSPAIGNYATGPLRIGWYMDWQALTRPPRPGGISYVPTIRLSNTTDPNNGHNYTTNPPWAELPAVIRAHPGAMWVIGNEPDRRYYQDGVLPDVYATAYHDLYCLIRGCPEKAIPAIDASALLIAGNIVQPTDLRLEYLQMVLDSYQTHYGRALPADAWSIHTYPLNEVSCDCEPNNCWGADIPPGINKCSGKRYSAEAGIAASVDPQVLKDFVRTFRQWMANHGYRDRPLLLTEWGVLMPNWYVSDSQVNAYMTDTTRWVLSTAESNGFPADNNRLVQRAAWFSLDTISLGDGGQFNGWLFNPYTRAQTVFGDNFAAQTKSIVPYVNLEPVQLTATPGQAGAYTLSAQIANNGNVSTSGPFVVRFYDGLPAGGQQIGADQVVPPLDGCAMPIASVSVQWPDGAPGKAYYVVVDATEQIREDKADNQLTAIVPQR